MGRRHGPTEARLCIGNEVLPWEGGVHQLVHQPARNSGEQRLTVRRQIWFIKPILKEVETPTNTDHAPETRDVPGSSPGLGHS